MDSSVMLVSSTVTEDYIPHISWKDQNKDKTKLWLSMISSVAVVVALYVELPFELSNNNSIFK